MQPAFRVKTLQPASACTRARGQHALLSAQGADSWRESLLGCVSSRPLFGSRRAKPKGFVFRFCFSFGDVLMRIDTVSCRGFDADLETRT